jgi:hypothetical protein
VVAPPTLLKAQGFHPPPLDMLKFNPAQPRVPSGNGRESGQWTSGDADITPVAFEGDTATAVETAYLMRFFQEGRTPKLSQPPPERKPDHEEGIKPEGEAPKGSPPKSVTSALKPSDFVGQDFGKLGVGIEKPNLSISRLSDHGEFRAQTRGVPVDDLQSTAENPLLVLRQSSGRFFIFLTKRWLSWTAKDHPAAARPRREGTGSGQAFFHPAGNGKKADMKLRLRKD